MSDSFAEAQAALEWLKQEQIERFRPREPEPEKPRTQPEQLLAKLNAACSRTVSVDSRWLG